jgi:hypothetical protein
MHIGGIGDMYDPRNHAVFALRRSVEWARLDSNQGPDGYEPPALTS